MPKTAFGFMNNRQMAASINRHAAPSNRSDMGSDETLGAEQPPEPAKLVVSFRNGDGSYRSETTHADGHKEVVEHPDHDDLVKHGTAVFHEVHDFENRARQMVESSGEEMLPEEGY